MRRTKLGVAAAVLVLMGAVPALATYNSIEHNLVDGTADTIFTSGDGKMKIKTPAGFQNNLITLNDPTPLPGKISNGMVDVETTLSLVVGGANKKAVFSGGHFMLTFDYDADGTGPGLPTPHAIGGNIGAMEFTINVIAPTYSTMDGLGYWDATVINLPGSGDWPEDTVGVPGRSNLDTLTLVFNFDLSAFNWDQTMGGRRETIYNISPEGDAVPEPSAAILAACLGGLAVLRRR